MVVYRNQIPSFDEVQEISDERMANYDVIRRHDRAVLEYMSMWLPYVDDATGDLREQRVPFVFATPKREHSANPNRKTAMVFDGDDVPTQMEKIVIPGMTLTRLDAVFDQSRWSYPEWRKLDFSSDLNMTMVSNFPLPYNFLYQIDFWAETYHDMNSFMEQFARKFPRPTWWLDITFPPPWGERTVHMQSQGSFSSASTLEGGEQQRQLRGVATINVLGWIPLDPRWVKTIIQIGIDYVDDWTGVILESVLSEEADRAAFRETGEAPEVLTWT